MQYDVLIVGGAAVGSAAAYFLTANPDFHGKVAVIEPDPSYQYSATALSAASIRHQFSTAENIKMSLFGTQFLRSFPDAMMVDGDRPDPAFVEGGYLFLAEPEGAEKLKRDQQLQNTLGADIHLYTPDQLQAKYPWMQVDDLGLGALGHSGEGWLDAYGMMQGIRRKAMAQGAEYIRSKVEAVTTRDDKVLSVTLDDGTDIACRALINAAGTGARAIAASAGIELPIESKKRSIFYFKTDADLSHCPMVIDVTGAYFRPEGEGFICGVAPDPADDPECFDFHVQHDLFEGTLWPILANRAPALEALRVERSWAGHYDMNMVDQNLIIGLHPALDNMYFANGLSGHGMQQSPAIGRALSELIIYGEYRSLDLSALGWQRILNNEPLVETGIV